MIVCTREDKSQWVFVTDVTTHSDKLSNNLRSPANNMKTFLLNTPKGLVVTGKEYIGPTPDGIINYPHREVLEVKVVFTKKTIESMLTQHLHQFQLGLLIHKCRKGRLLFYVAPSQMTEFEASAHIVDTAHVEVGTFLKADKWVQLFATKSHDLYANHLICFYKVNFDAEEAYQLISFLIKNGKETFRTTKKRILG